MLEQVGREAMAQGVRRHTLGDLGHIGRGVAGARELTRPCFLAYACEV